MPCFSAFELSSLIKDVSFQKKGILFPAHTDLNFFSSRAWSEPVSSPVRRSPGTASRPTQTKPGECEVSLQTYSYAAATKHRNTPGWTCDLESGTLGNSPSAEMAEHMESPRGHEKSNQLLQEGHIWSSMRNTTLIQGSGLLLLLVFWNSVTWHLQRFWDASGYFCQTQWEKLLSTFEGYEWILYYIGVILVPGLCFWGLSGLLLLVDTTEKPTFISRYRIQRGKNEPVDPVKLRQALLTVLFNQNFISIPMLVIYYPFLKWRRDPCSRELPTFHWFLVEMAFFTLLQEILFYYAHRLFHHPMLYKKSHKKHHEWTAPIGLVSIYADPPEHVVANMLPVLVGPLAMGSHLSSITVWLSMVLIVSIINHSGYHLPFLPSPEFHDYHHLKSNQCYGALGLMDHLHGTDTLFKQTKAYERHVILLGFTPLSESIPDSPKKTRSAL